MSVQATAYRSFSLSQTFITVVECMKCDGKAHLVTILRDLCPRTEREMEMRLFQCEDCGHPQVIGLEDV